MHTFEIKPTHKTKKWLKANKINCLALQHALCMLYADIKPTKRYRKTILTLQVDYKNDSSAYYFGTNKIFICSDPDYLAKSRKQKNFVIFLHFLHEFRHWMQSQILKIKDSQLQYNDYDLANNTKKYWNNKFEIDARRFERRYVKKFLRYYVNFKKVCQ